MPAVTLNSVSFAGSIFDADTVRRAPQKVNRQPEKVEVVLRSANGTLSRMHYANKGVWELTWEQVPETTRAAVKALYDLTADFSAVVPDGTFTVQSHNGDYREDQVLAIPGVSAPTYYFTVTLTIRQV